VINPEGKILLVRSPKWNNTWVIPGGHVDYREKLTDAAVREVKEETGLDTNALYCVSTGNLVDDPTFPRACQLVFFHFVCQAHTSECQIDNREAVEFAWFTQEEVLQQNLASLVAPTIQNYIDGVKIPIAEAIFQPRD